MELINAKYLSMLILLFSNLIMTFLGLFLQRFVFARSERILSIISCLTSGILLGTLLMLILPHSLSIIIQQWHNQNFGYFFIGLGFFLICLIEESVYLYDQYLSKKANLTDNQQLIDSSASKCSSQRLTRLITLVFALSVHYFFNGVLIGGQTNLDATFWILVSAICFHMSLIALTMTLRLLTDHENSLRVFLAMLTWSLMGPLGIVFSLAISSDASSMNSIDGILQCISAGTFIYITFIDMLHTDLTKRNLYPLMNIFIIFIGFLLIVLTSLGHKHSD